MNESSATSSCCATPAPGNASGQTDASARLPLFALFGGAAFWLVLSSIFGLIGSIKFHGPKFLADSPDLTYGRVYPAWSNLLVYGFCIPAGLGAGLWLLGRLGRVRISRPWLVFLGAKLWHIGVLAGLIGILTGGTTGFEWLEMPRYAAAILFVSFVLIALCGFDMHQERAEQNMFPSQWFVLAALFWFPWIYSSACLLLMVFPVRGVVQAGIAWWFSGNLLVVWLGLSGLAATLYFLPKLAKRPLKSRYLALFAFLTLIVFGTWTGIPRHAALPAWMPALSGAATLLVLVPSLAVSIITRATTRGTAGCCGHMGYFKFGACSFVLSGLMLAATGVPEVARVTDFTWYGPAQNYLRLYGFFSMTMFGAAYYILPRVAGREFAWPGLLKAHFLCGAGGVALLVLPLAIGGVVQGFKLLNPAISNIDLSKSTLLFLRISTLGETLIALGAIMFLVNVLALMVACYCAVYRKARAEFTAVLEPAEVKA